MPPTPKAKIRAMKGTAAAVLVLALPLLASNGVASSVVEAGAAGDEWILCLVVDLQDGYVAIAAHCDHLLVACPKGLGMCLPA